MQTGFSVMDAMTTMPVRIVADKTIAECAKLMQIEDVSSILVTTKDDNKKLVGVIDEHDIIGKVVAKNKEPKSILVDKCMTKKVITIPPDKDLYDALVKMRDNEIKCLPVVERGVLKGIVTFKDILKIEPDLFDIIISRSQIREEYNKPVFGQFPKGYLS